MATRRAFLAGLMAAALPKPTWADVGSPACLSAGKRGEGYVLHGLSAVGDSLFQIDLPGRGHAAAAHPTRPLAVAFARRPGTFALVIDCSTGAVRHQITPPVGRQFNGHGAFSADGSVLYTSEVVAATSLGRIGLWDTADFSRIGEWASGGIGPHDIKRLADGSLVVANGGIATDPADRTKLNIATMRPNLIRLSSEGIALDGAELAPEYAQNSIRHLAVGPDGTIAFALQWEGDLSDPVPLLGLWQPGKAARLCGVPQDQALRMQGYAGSIAMAGDGKIALTSPRGGVVMIHGADGTHLASHARAEICGVAALGDGLMASDGMGALWTCGTDGLALMAKGGPAWDNHLIAIG